MVDTVLYEDDVMYHADIVLTQDWMDKTNPRNFYFKNSMMGNTYRILFRKDTEYLHNAETEYSAKVFQPIIDDLKTKTFDSVLLLGLGTGELIKKIREFSDCNITVIEHDKRAEHYKHTIADNDFNLIIGDVYNYNTFSRILKDYDVIIDDIKPSFEYKMPFLRYNTSKFYYFMINYRVFKCPYTFLRIDRDMSINKINEVDKKTVDFYQKMIYTLV